MAAAKGTGRLATGRFATRAELTSHVWAMRRQQVFPNVKTIAFSCGVTVGVVKGIIATGEGHDDYLDKGCLTGSAPMRRQN